MPPHSIWSLSLIIHCALNLNYFTIWVEFEFKCFKVYYTGKDVCLFKLLLLAYFVCLITKFKLQAVSTFKLSPLMVLNAIVYLVATKNSHIPQVLFAPILPCPVEILDIFKCYIDCVPLILNMLILGVIHQIIGLFYHWLIKVDRVLS